jgi:outer membrane protein assembly factor BamB
MSLSLPRLLALAVLLVGLSFTSAADWPQYLGPKRDGSSPETGLLTGWPAAGPKVLWKVEGGEGYSSVAVAGGKCYTLVQRGGEELVVALDVANGKEVWKHKLGGAYKNQYGDGPRCTPAIDGGKVYVQSTNGPLVCLEADSGKMVWEHDLFKEFNSKNIDYGYACSPMIEGDLLLTEPGGKGASVVAFDKKSGKVAWKAGDDKAAYASPIVMTVAGKKQAIFFNAGGLLSVGFADGKELWQVPWKTEFDCNIATPLLIGDKLFVSSGENVGCAMFSPSATGKPELLWESKGVKSVMKNYWATAVHHDKHLYGISGEYEGVVNLNCVDAASGKLVWSEQRFQRGNVTIADGHLYILTIDGNLIVAPASPKGYQEKGKAKLLEPAKYINAPTISDKKLYGRDQKSIICVDIAGK